MYSVGSSSAVDQTSNVFKFGIELQEGTRLCPWADGEMRFQKEPIFSVSKGGKKLWDLVIDTRDIEFVTVPFSNHDRILLNECMEAIEIACDVLSNLNRNNKYPGSVTFKKWINGESKGESILTDDGQIEESRIDMLHIAGFQERLKTPFSVDLKGAYFLIISNALMTPGSKANAQWVPTFKPQVTIQHKLEKSIPLFLSLFCFDAKLAVSQLQDEDWNSYVVNYSKEREKFRINRIATTVEIIDTLSNLIIDGAETPDELCFESKTSAIDGLLFLHTYTCICLASSGTSDENYNIKETLRCFLSGRQVDAKRNLGLLSRRPFFVMWRDISDSVDEPFSIIHRKKLSQAKQQELANKFPFINYAEEYIDNINKRRMDLSLLQNSFDSPSPSLLLLLKNGIISTSMLRKMRVGDIRSESDSFSTVIRAAEIFSNYYDGVVASVDNPVSSYQFNLATRSIERVECEVDALSPPYFLSHNDSMGAYKGDINTSYGEAVIEIREIENIGSYALAFMEMPIDLKGLFLTNIRRNEEDSSLRDQVNALFSFLEMKLRLIK